MDVSELKKLLKQKKITYDELAKRSGVSKSSISKIFGGFAVYPRIDTMQAIERALGVADGGVLESGKVLTEKQKRLLRGFDELVEPMQDFIIETVERLAQKGNIGEKQA